MSSGRTHHWLAPALIMLATACVSNPSVPEDPQLAAGHALASRYCASCHAVGRGDASRHPDAPALRTLSRSYPVSALEEALAEGIMVGHPDMPEFRFPPAEIASLIGYLESIQSPDTP